MFQTVRLSIIRSLFTVHSAMVYVILKFHKCLRTTNSYPFVKLVHLFGLIIKKTDSSYKGVVSWSIRKVTRLSPYPTLVPRQCMYSMQSANYQQERFCSGCFYCPLSVSFHLTYALIFYTWHGLYSITN